MEANQRIAKRRQKLFNQAPKKEDLINSLIKRSLSLRKEKLDQFINNKRFHSAKETPMDIEKLEENSNDEAEYYSRIQKETYKLEFLQTYYSALYSTDRQELLKGLVAIRKLLSDPINPPIKQVIENGGALKILELFERVGQFNNIVTFEILWILTNLVSGESEYTIFLCQHCLLQLLSENMKKADSIQLLDEYVWIIANVAAEEINCIKSQMLSMDFLEMILNFSKMEISFKMYHNCMWAICNLLRGLKEIEVIGKYTDVLCSICCNNVLNLKTKINSTNFNSDALNAVGYSISILSVLTDLKAEIVERITESNVIDSLFELMEEKNFTENKLFYLRLIRVIGNFSATTDHINTSAIVDKGILPQLIKVLKFETQKEIRKETCWILSNISAGLPEHTNLFFSREDYLPTIFKVFHKDRNDVQKEALWCVANLTSTNSKEHFNTLLKFKIINMITNWICDADFRISAVCIEALDNIFKFAESSKDNLMKKRIQVDVEICGLINLIEDLEGSENELVSLKATRFLNAFFRDDDKIIIYEEDNLLYSPFVSPFIYNNNFNYPSEVTEFGNIIRGLNKENQKMDEDDENLVRFVSRSNSNDSFNNEKDDIL